GGADDERATNERHQQGGVFAKEPASLWRVVGVSLGGGGVLGGGGGGGFFVGGPSPPPPGGRLPPRAPPPGRRGGAPGGGGLAGGAVGCELVCGNVIRLPRGRSRPSAASLSSRVGQYELAALAASQQQEG